MAFTQDIFRSVGSIHLNPVIFIILMKMVDLILIRKYAYQFLATIQRVGAIGPLNP